MYILLCFKHNFTSYIIILIGTQVISILLILNWAFVSLHYIFINEYSIDSLTEIKKLCCIKNVHENQIVYVKISKD